VRTLALVIVTFNVTGVRRGPCWCCPALERLGVDEVGYGLLTTAVAVGGLVATVSYGWLERRIPLAVLMRTCLVLEVLMHLALALTTAAWLALLIMVVFGLYAFVWGTLSTAVRQRAVPQEYQGRVGSAYRVAIMAGLVIGTPLGGFIANWWGLTAPFWFAFVGSGITLALVWRQLADIAHADEEATAQA
jgi:predicted MFS family arabinose efflux permease